MIAEKANAMENRSTNKAGLFSGAMMFSLYK